MTLKIHINTSYYNTLLIVTHKTPFLLVNNKIYILHYLIVSKITTFFYTFVL